MSIRVSKDSLPAGTVMAPVTPIEQLVATKPSAELDADVYLNDRPLTWREGAHGAFGGSLLGQSVTAAAATVPATFRLYSVQSAFLRPATGKLDIAYRVERAADGRTFATRVVRAVQAGKCVYVSTLSFQQCDGRPARGVLTYGLPAAGTGGVRPDDIPKDLLKKMMAATIGDEAPVMATDAEEEPPLDWRPIGARMAEDPTKFRQMGFVRSPPMVSDEASVHQAALVYMSDAHLLGSALNASPVALGPRWRNLMLAATLTHNLSIHDPAARVDEWMVGEQNTSWGSEGRVLVHQRFWNAQTGALVLTATQEGVVRLKESARL